MNNSNKKKSILWLSPYAPYDSVAHAGGQDFNHFLKYLHATQHFDLHVASLCLKDEIPFIDLNQYGISNTLYTINKSKIMFHIGLIVDRLSKYNIFDSCGGLLTPYTKLCFLRLLKKYSRLCHHPDIVIMHWTQAALMSPIISKMFPTASRIIIEVDVAYLGYKRQYLNITSKIQKKLWKKKYIKLKYSELLSVKNSSLSIVLNEKDAEILKKDGIQQDKLFVSIPFYHNYSNYQRKNPNSNILYFGYMGREENHLSALWFIKNVMPLLEDEIQFTIIGTEPKEELLKFQNDRIHVMGYVKDIVPYFQEGLCMVAPLVLGAGIKIKILEGLSFGIPVLTNSIGIEGIPAQDKHDFFYCETPEEYAKTIVQLKNINIQTDISTNARNFININFNTDKRLDELTQLLLSL
ncbi:glycosyltransferase [Kineothrix sedimenti]|uniref:Glycosyltransferase n=1 Tax=Kineothrix sedimenti TaxID=3123317 RepID=A0ABZ3ETE7_9FIRM